MHERIKTVRKFLKLRQQDFADALGVTRNVIANIESNRYEASETLIELISLKYDIDKNWLKTGDGNMKKDDVQLNYKLMKMYDNLTDEHKHIVNRFIEMLHDDIEIGSEYNKLEYTCGEIENFKEEEKNTSENAV